MTTSDPYAGLRVQLNETYQWPAPYLFKWVVPVARVPQLEALLGGADIARRPSKNGRYVGITVTLAMDSADAVIALYERIAKIEGVIAL